MEEEEEEGEINGKRHIKEYTHGDDRNNAVSVK